MGLLDDAIREHLDLKRRRGADPAEVQRAEREALGPVRRNREAPDAGDIDDEPVAGGIAYDQAGDDADWAYDESGDPRNEIPGPEGASMPPLELAGADDAPVPPRGDTTTAFDDSAFGESAFEEPMFDDEPPPPSPARFAETGSGDETTEYNVEEALADGDDSGDDMLEETPEFLQDTPDHDRLWFEQRPPKDFDFDG